MVPFCNDLLTWYLHSLTCCNSIPSCTCHFHLFTEISRSFDIAKLNRSFLLVTFYIILAITVFLFFNCLLLCFLFPYSPQLSVCLVRVPYSVPSTEWGREADPGGGWPNSFILSYLSHLCPGAHLEEVASSLASILISNIPDQWDLWRRLLGVG